MAAPGSTLLMSSDSAISQEENHQYYKEVIQENKKWFKCSICERLLSRKQRIECHLQSVHGKGPFKRKYKLYCQDPSIPVPRTTRYNHEQKRSKTFSADHELDADVASTLADSSTHWSTSTCVESYASYGSNLNEENESTSLGLFNSLDSTESLEEIDIPLEPLEDLEYPARFSDNNEDSEDSDNHSFEDVLSSSEVDSDSDNNGANDDSSDEDNNSDHDNPLVESFSDQEKACMAILSYVSRHCITSEAAKDMIDLIKIACPETKMFRTLNYSIVQEVCGKCELHIYDICENCLALFPLEDPNKYRCSTAGCNGLRYKGSVHQQEKREHKNSFVTVNIHNQLKDLLKREGIWSTIQNRIKCRGKEIIADIMDGKYYVKLCEKGQFLHNKSNISLIFNTDGAPLYSSSSVSLWPVFLAVNELPSPERFSKQNMLMWGIWQGKGKPPFNVYFEPFASQMNQLYNDGVQIVLNGEQSPVTVKVAVLLGSADLQGKAYLLCMTQHNGESGCLTCEEPGVVVKQGKGHARCYPYKIPTEAAPKRTSESFLANAVEAHRGPLKKKVAGIFDVTSLALMPWFDIVLGMVPDYMHGCLLGITKTLLYKWLSASNHKKPYFIGGQIADISKRMLGMRPPDYLTRLPRDLEKHFKNLKASELQAWLLYYSLPCLIGYLPDKYLLHFAHLAEGIFILLGDAITPSQLNRARDLLHTFYKDFQSIYGDGSCGLNVHNTGVHLADYVEGWGPLWAWSTFGFEDMNGTIMDLTHGTGNVCRQVLWMLHAQSRLRCDIKAVENSPIKDFIQRMLNTKREIKKLKAAQNCQIAGGAKKLTDLSQDVMDKINIEITGQAKMKVLRVVKNGHVFYSKEYTRMVKRNGYVALFENGKIGEIEFFVWDKDSGITLAVFREVNPDLVKPFFFQDAGHHLLRMKPERSELQVERIEKIQEKVLFLEGNKDNICIIRVPNFCGVCG